MTGPECRSGMAADATMIYVYCTSLAVVTFAESPPLHVRRTPPGRDTATVHRALVPRTV